jgi:hypothetical protein
MGPAVFPVFQRESLNLLLRTGDNPLISVYFVPTRTKGVDESLRHLSESTSWLLGQIRFGHQTRCGLP